MKYIFVAGAPGSKWSSVIKNIYYSPDVDRSDYSDERTYYHDATGYRELMHLGAYYDPGMEFGDWFLNLDQHRADQCEKEFDRPFSNQRGVRIVKSHVFAHHIDFLKKTWPHSPIVAVTRPNDACLGWWVRCGEFDITYPRYDKYYKNLRNMGHIIDQQNADLAQALKNHSARSVNNNHRLCAELGIASPPAEYQQDYKKSDVEVYVL
jgi:hypothetical protein